MEDRYKTLVFVIHSLLFLAVLLVMVEDQYLLSNEQFVNILYILLSTLLVHGGYIAGNK